MEAGKNSLDRALALLEIVEKAPGGLTTGQIRAELGIPKSSFAYLITRLVQAGYIMRDTETHRYKIGLTPLALAYGSLRELGIRSVTEPTLYRLANDTKLAASIGIMKRRRVLLVDRVESPTFAREAIDFSRRLRRREERDLGREFSMYTNATGKVLLAYLPEKDVLQLLARERLVKITSKTIVSIEKILEELEKIRELGYAQSNEEQYIGVRGLAAPIFDANMNVSAAVSVTGHSAEPIWLELEWLSKVVKEAARVISVQSRGQRYAIPN